MKRKMLLLTLAIPVILCQDALAQSSRLTGQAHWSSNGAILLPGDSTAYSYSNGRGGDLNSQMKYDQAVNWYFQNDSAYVNNLYYLQSFDAHNNLLSTITQYWDASALAWINWTNVLYTYNSSNQLISKIYQNWGGGSWANSAEDVYNYNTAGQVYADQYNLWNSLTSTFTPNTQKIYTYDVAGNLASEVDQTYNTGSTLYDYTAEFLYTYSGTQLLTTTYNTWSGSAWVGDYMYTNTYDSTGDLLTNLYQTYSGTAWVNQSLKVYSNFNGMMLPANEIDQTWNNTGSGSWDNVTQYTYGYNSFGQLTQAVGESWNTGVGWEYASGDPASFYYYEPYSPTSTTSVKNVANVGGDANIYPVPAQNNLHIDLNWTVAQTAVIGIYDMNGRLVISADAPLSTQYRGTVSVNNLADGMYVIRINGTQGQIVKQIVVAH